MALSKPDKGKLTNLARRPRRPSINTQEAPTNLRPSIMPADAAAGRQPSRKLLLPQQAASSKSEANLGRSPAKEAESRSREKCWPMAKTAQA